MQARGIRMVLCCQIHGCRKLIDCCSRPPCVHKRTRPLPSCLYFASSKCTTDGSVCSSSCLHSQGGRTLYKHHALQHVPCTFQAGANFVSHSACQPLFQQAIQVDQQQQHPHSGKIASCKLILCIIMQLFASSQQHWLRQPSPTKRLLLACKLTLSWLLLLNSKG